jgi:hypothetical protein
MNNMNLIPVQGWSISIVTSPPQAPPGGATFSFEVDVRLQNGQQGALRVDSIDELMAICAILQIPGGQLLFNPNGQTLIKTS